MSKMGKLLNIQPAAVSPIVTDTRASASGAPQPQPQLPDLIRFGANAIANVMAAERNLSPQDNMLELVDPTTRNRCLAYANAAFQAAAAIGMAKQLAKQAQDGFKCTVCGAEEDKEQREPGESAATLVFACGAQDLLFQNAQRTRRIMCPAPPASTAPQTPISTQLPLGI